jgi:hypothetical protein
VLALKVFRGRSFSDIEADFNKWTHDSEVAGNINVIFHAPTDRTDPCITVLYDPNACKRITPVAGVVKKPD